MSDASTREATITRARFQSKCDNGLADVCRRRRRLRGSRQFLSSHAIVSLLLMACLASNFWACAFLQPQPKLSFRDTSTRLHDESPLHNNGHQLNGESYDAHSVPKHVGFICDGNSRWAKARHLPTSLGHLAGADRVVEVLQALQKSGVTYCTMYGFSTENWKRPEKEVAEILSVVESTARQCYDRALLEGIRFKVVGDLDDGRIPSSLRETLCQLEEETLRKVAHLEEPQTLCLAINYGGRQDLLAASKRMATLISEGTLAIEDVTEETLAGLLSTSGIPDPDLIIRTSGERRLSNFLLWNAAYAEMYFTDALWPDFDQAALNEALAWYASRSRRFGARQPSMAAP